MLCSILPLSKLIHSPSFPGLLLPIFSCISHGTPIFVLVIFQAIKRGLLPHFLVLRTSVIFVQKYQWKKIRNLKWESDKFWTSNVTFNLLYGLIIFMVSKHGKNLQKSIFNSLIYMQNWLYLIFTCTFLRISWYLAWLDFLVNIFCFVAGS